MRIHVHEFLTFLPQVATPLIPHSSVSYFTLNVNILWAFLIKDSAYWSHYVQSAYLFMPRGYFHL